MIINNLTRSRGREGVDISSKNLSRRRFLAAIGGGVPVVAGCVGDDEDEPELVDDEDDGGNDEDDDQAEDDEDEDNDDDEPEEVEAIVGDLVEGENLQLVIENVETTTQIGEFQEADEGKEFVAIQLSMKNIADEFVHVSHFVQASLRDDEDYSYDMAIAVTDDPTFNDGQFAPGEVERGTIVFEVPEDATGRTLQFDMDVSIFGGVDRVEVDLEDETDVHQLEQDLTVDLYDIGETVEFGGVEVELREKVVETELGQFTEAEEGYEYVILDLAITNETGEEQRVSTMLQMMLKDGDGWTHQEDWMATSELDRTFDETAPLANGETRAGQVAYEVEEGLSPLYWVFEYTLWTEGDKTFWQLR